MDALKDATGSFGPGSGRKVEQSLIDKYVQDSHSLSETEQQRLAEAVRTKTPKAKSVIRIMPEDPGWTPSHTVSFDQPKSTSSAVQDVLAGKPIGHISWKGSDGALVLIENPKTGLDVDYSKTNTPDFSAAGEKETIVAGKYYVHERREVPEPGTREEDGYKVPMYVLREHAQPTEYNLPTLEQTVGETGSSLLDDAKTADQSLATGTPKKSPHGFATLGEVSSIGSPDGLFTAHEPEPVPAQSSAPPIAPVQPPPVPQQPIRPIAPVTATAPSYQPSLSSASIGVSPGIGSSIYDAPPGALPTGTPGVFRIPGFAGDIYVDRYGRPLSGAGTAPQQVPQPAPGQFAQHHPTLAKTGDTASQLLVASLPGAVTRNPATIATSAYSDLGILLHALDTRKPSKSGPDSRGGTVLNGVEQLFGVATPQQRYQQKSNPLGGIPPIFRTPPFLPNGTTAFGSSPSGHGQLPTQTGQSLPGTDANAGTILTKTESGLILRQPQGSVLNNAPDISPLPQSVPNPIDVLGTPTPPPYTENPFEIPHAPPFEDHLPASADPNVQLADPNANADAAHTAILNNGLSQTAPFNSGGAEILPLSVLDAANPFHRPGSAFKAIQNAGQAALSGFMAGGIGSGTGHPAGYQTESTISFGDGSSQSFTGGGLFGDSGSSGIGQIFDGTDPSILGPNTPVPWEDSSGPNLGPASKLGLGTFLGPGLGIFSGLKQGGTKGHLSAASSGLALAAQLDPEPISKTILGLAAGISGVLHAIMGDPRAKRQEQLTKEIEGEKIRAFDFTQPGITLNESAAGGHAVSEAFNGALQVSAGRPVVYNRNEAVGFDPIHQDRVVTRAIRQVTTIGDVHGNSPSTIIPTTPATALLGNSRPYQTGLPVSSADLTTPQLPLSSTDLTPNPVQSEAAANPLAALAALQSQITNHYGGNQISVQVPPHLFNAAVMQQYANSIADVIDQKLRTSTHPLNQTIRDTVRTS